MNDWDVRCGDCGSHTLTACGHINYMALTSQQHQEIIDLYLHGVANQEISRRFSLSPGYVSKLVAQLGVRRKPTHKYDVLKAHAKVICQRYQKGEAQGDIAIAFQVDQRLIRRILNENHVQVEHGQAGARCPRWRGGRALTKQGYIRIAIDPNHPFSCMADKRRYVLEHRWVMAEHLDRPLHAFETVHHKNGIKDDNRLENLQLLIGTHSHGVVPHCLDCGSHRIGHSEIN